MAEDRTLHELATSVVQELTSAGIAVSTAESCTGGWIAKALTDVPGSSACFAYGIVSYSNVAKESILGVDNRTLTDCGAVSEPVVREMAEGVIRLSGSDVSVAVSGIAGPDGGTVEETRGFGVVRVVLPALRRACRPTPNCSDSKATVKAFASRPCCMDSEGVLARLPT